jgi:hypothetical protein
MKLAIAVFATLVSAGNAFCQKPKEYPLQVEMSDVELRTWGGLSYSWWASAIIDGQTYDAKCENTLCAHALVHGTYKARIEGDNLYVYGEMSNGKGKVVRFKIKRSQNGTMHGTVQSAEKKPEAN